MNRLPHRIDTRPGRQRGAVAVVFAMLLALLLGFVGLGLDAGRLFVAKTELQNTADACALAAASALTRATTSQLSIAENRGMIVGAANRVGMQSTVPSLSANSSITFATSLAGPFLPRTSVTDIRAQTHARCTVTEPDIAPILIRVVNAIPGVSIGTTSVSASSIATLKGTPANCSLPIGLCKATNGPGSGLNVGQWAIGTFSNADVGKFGTASARFLWVGFDPAAGVSDTEEQLGSSSGQCALIGSMDQVYPINTGVIARLQESWDMRFGYWKGPAASNIAKLPDKTGWYRTPPVQYYASPLVFPLPPLPTNVAGAFLTARLQYLSGANVSVPAGEMTVPQTGGYKFMTSTELRADGSDRRMAVAPVINCTNLQAGLPTPVDEWACLLLLFPSYQGMIGFEYRGAASSKGSGCATTGLPAANGPRVPVLVQ